MTGYIVTGFIAGVVGSFTCCCFIIVFDYAQQRYEMWKDTREWDRRRRAAQ